METLKLTAPDISCEHCQHTIEQAVGAMPGVRHVSVAIEPKQVMVEFDPAQVSRKQIEETLEEEGYPVA